MNELDVEVNNGIFSEEISKATGGTTLEGPPNLARHRVCVDDFSSDHVLVWLDYIPAK
jgi:hypothetical protein